METNELEQHTPCDKALIATGNSKPKRTPDQRAADLVIIQQEVIKGHSARVIADKLASMRPYRISSQMIRYEVKRLVNEWKKEATELYAAFRERQLMRLEAQHAECAEAWEQSKTPENPAGNPAYQRMMLDIKQEENKVSGIEAAIKLEHSGANGEAITMVVVQSPIPQEEVTGPPPVKLLPPVQTNE